MEVRKIRIIRMKCKINLQELADAAGVSHQRLSEIELCGGGFEPQTYKNIQKALYEIAFKRNEECTELYKVLKKHCDTLLDVVEETTYEL